MYIYVHACANTHTHTHTGSTAKKKGGSVKTVRTPQNIDAVTESFEQSPRR